MYRPSVQCIFQCQRIQNYITRLYISSSSTGSAAVSQPKKDTANELAQAYNPKAVESDWYDWWQSENFFSSDCAARGAAELKSDKPVFSLLLPPPNVTGTLHLGHALTCSIQDVLVRWRRMRGEHVVWVPGSDHAGIATQAVVERHLSSRGVGSRKSLGREKFLAEAWKWKREKGDTISQQLKQMGSSLDWTREFFTLDERQSMAVQEAFVRLFEDGLVYRASSLVSWSCALQSAIADIEVEWRELSEPTAFMVPNHNRPVQFGLLTHVALPFSNGKNGELVVATTRVETMLGDVAVAVHPDDPRYQHLVGSRVQHPLREQGDTLPVIADPFVDPKFGTGVVKITPAHDAKDYEVGKRHNLPAPCVFTEDGHIAPEWDHFGGLQRFAAREAITERLSQLGLLRGTSPVTGARVPFCSRSGDAVELLLRPQWFIRCQEMAERAVEAVRQGELIIDPPAFHRVWFDWLENIRDWCISRQLWWGHRIPAYLCTVPDSQTETWVAARSETEARQKATQVLGTAEVEVQQDMDVLDTWFSSALLPFSTLGWPREDAPDLRRLYPLSLMETGHDILFFWVARMVMLGTQLTGQLPFKQVLLHGIICDAHGRKMSKSLGNVIYPEDIIRGTPLEVLLDRTKQAYQGGGSTARELQKALSAQRAAFPQGIPECGTDALRFTLCTHNLKAHTVTFDISECHTNRLFCNKIWQATRFVLMAVSQAPSCSMAAPSREAQLGLMERWVLSRLAEAVKRVEEALQQADLCLATAAIKGFVYGTFCDVYLESCKPLLQDPSRVEEVVCVLVTCLETSLGLLAPFMPYLSEELYQHLPQQRRSETSVHRTSFPSAQQWSCWRDESCEKEVESLLTVVVSARRLRDLAQIPSKEAKVRVQVGGEVVEMYQRGRSILQTLSRCSDLEVCSEVAPPSMSELISPLCTVHLLGTHPHINSTEKQEKIQKEIDKIVARMASVNYQTKAPPERKEANERQLQRFQAELQKWQSISSTK